jgi:hypothetical protein
MSSCTTHPGKKQAESPATPQTGMLDAGNYHKDAEAAHVLW